jgi:hypothetical protein
MSTFGKCNGGGRRSALRERVPLIATFNSITRADRALVVDVSATGVRLRGRDLPTANELVEVGIEAVRAFGIVMWSENEECGIEFEPPLSIGGIKLLQANARAAAGLPPQVRAALDDWMTGFAR